MGQEQLYTEDANDIQLGQNGLRNFNCITHHLWRDARRHQGEIQDVVAVQVFDHAVVGKAAVYTARRHH